MNVMGNVADNYRKVNIQINMKREHANNLVKCFFGKLKVVQKYIFHFGLPDSFDYTDTLAIDFPN